MIDGAPERKPVTAMEGVSDTVLFAFKGGVLEDERVGLDDGAFESGELANVDGVRGREISGVVEGARDGNAFAMSICDDG